MNKRDNFSQKKKATDLSELGYNDYAEMFEEGYSDAEISREFGINEDFVRSLRDEYNDDF